MKTVILDILRKREGYVSGQELSDLLGVSRTAVWKVISQLKEQGYSIESVTKKGYILKEVSDRLIPEEVQYGLQTDIMGQDIYYYDEVGSTNDEAKIKANQGVSEGALIVTEKQTAGKGRLGRSWVSPKSAGIWMSLVLRPEIAPVEATKITLLAGLAVCRAIQNITGLEARIKWPNDIVVEGKKICGILTEMSAEIERINYVILGIGINVNTEDFPEEVAGVAASLKQISGRSWSRKEIIQELLKEFEQLYLSFVNHCNPMDFLVPYKRNCITLHNTVCVSGKGMSFVGRAVDITEDGTLLVQKEDGEVVSVLSGEVSVRGVYGYV